jgi:hypothetical protein
LLKELDRELTGADAYISELETRTCSPAKPIT